MEAFANLLGNHHGTVLAAGTAEANRQITLTFVDVMRKQINE
jgi:hypothetical protein